MILGQIGLTKEFLSCVLEMETGIQIPPSLSHNNHSMFDFADGSDSDEEIWEDVQIQAVQRNTEDPVDETFPDAIPDDLRNAIDSQGSFDITLGNQKELTEKTESKQNPKGLLKEARYWRLQLHKAHLVSLLACGILRNQWCEDNELKALLLSFVPPRIVTSITRDPNAILPVSDAPTLTRASSSSHTPPTRKRSKPVLDNQLVHNTFLNSLVDLMRFWRSRFPCSWTRVGSASFNCADELRTMFSDELERTPALLPSREVKKASGTKGKGAVKKSKSEPMRLDEDETDVGGMDPNVSSMWLVAAIRACAGVPTRLVVSMHPIPLSFAKKAASFPAAANASHSPSGSPNEKKRKAAELDSSSQASPSKKQKSKSAVDLSQISSNPESAVGAPYPIRMWCEVLAQKTTKEWICLDPVSGAVGKSDKFEPASNAPLQSQLSYVVAFDPETGAKDVTQRYASQWGARTARNRMSDKGEAWWERVLEILKPWREEEEIVAVEESDLNKKMADESMPTNLNGFKNHPLFALEKQCKKNEVIYPRGPEHAIGKYKGDWVYPRKNVKEVLSERAWKVRGRSIIDDEVPVRYTAFSKSSPASARKRARENDDDGIGAGGNDSEGEEGPEPDDEMRGGVGLFGEWQTCEYKAGEVIDGVIPKNEFGNVEVLHKSMLPKGAVHLRASGLGKIAKTLGIDYAPAVVGFEFKRRMTYPVIEGIVVPEESAELIMLAVDEMSERQRATREKKRRELSRARWVRFMHKLVVVKRIHAEYGSSK
ncbi:Rad4 transglutaminase-like domain-containing protein [Cladochytrium replicatum]|nr:Rad4 transglutaminase-like domain-containing protein [Cladochytrium replicatum]